MQQVPVLYKMSVIDALEKQLLILTDITPKPISKQRAIFAFNAICTRQRIKIGKAAKAKSDTTEITGRY